MLHSVILACMCVAQFVALARQLDQVMVEHHSIEELHRDHSKTVVKRIMQGGKCYIQSTCRYSIIWFIKTAYHSNTTLRLELQVCSL